MRKMKRLQNRKCKVCELLCIHGQPASSALTAHCKRDHGLETKTYYLIFKKVERKKLRRAKVMSLTALKALLSLGLTPRMQSTAIGTLCSLRKSTREKVNKRSAGS